MSALNGSGKSNLLVSFLFPKEMCFEEQHALERNIRNTIVNTIKEKYPTVLFTMADEECIMNALGNLPEYPRYECIKKFEVDGRTVFNGIRCEEIDEYYGGKSTSDIRLYYYDDTDVVDEVVSIDITYACLRENFVRIA